MKKIKTLLTVLMVFTMVLSLASCGSTGSNFLGFYRNLDSSDLQTKGIRK